MKILAFSLLLSATLGVRQASAHDAVYVCQRVCVYGDKQVSLNSRSREEESALDGLKTECDKLGGELSSAGGQGYCHVEWQ